MSKKQKQPSEPSESFLLFRVLRVKNGDYALATYEANGKQLKSVKISNEDLQSIILHNLEDEALGQCRNTKSVDLLEFVNSLKH